MFQYMQPMSKHTNSSHKIPSDQFRWLPFKATCIYAAAPDMIECNLLLIIPISKLLHGTSTVLVARAATTDASGFFLLLASFGIRVYSHPLEATYLILNR